MSSGGFGGLVDRQIRAWEARQRAAREQPAAGRQRSEHGPWLTISRQSGSGGRDLALLVAQRLGWDTFDHEIVEAIAKRGKLNENVVERHDEHAARIFDDYLSSLMVPSDPGHAAYLQQMTEVIGQMARDGRAIILGRGANWFLNARYGLRLRTIAPIERRVEYTIQHESVDAATARKRVMLRDAERRAFVRQVFHKDVDDPLGYDLVLNLGALDLDTAADVVIAALHQKFAKVH